MDGYLLGIDVGTYESKGTLVDTEGRVVASAATGHPLSMPRPGWFEHDAETVWWQDCVTLCRRLLQTSGVPGERILGVGCSAIAPCVLPVDGAGRPLRPAILYGIDTRAAEEVDYLEEELGAEAIFAHSGLHLSSQSAGPKILWLRRHEPAIWAATTTILTGSGYLAYRLTGEQTIDVYTATAYAPLLDVATARWSEIMSRPITPLERLPRLVWSGEVIGRVTRQAASETGLAAGTPVVAGTADAATEALSAGLAEPGDLLVMYGSSIFFIQKTARLLRSERLWPALFLEPNSYVVAAGMSTGGALTRWFRDQLSPQEVAAEAAGGAPAYAALAELAAGSQPGARGLVALPYFAGERTPLNDPLGRGVFAGLTLSHTRADLYRALLEGVGYGIRHNIEAMIELGAPPRRVLAAGGGTRNPLWLQIVSDIAGIEQWVPAEQMGACYGDAFLAGIGAGLFRDTGAVSHWVRYQAVVQPSAAAHRHYDDYYAVYRDLYSSSAGAVHRLARLGAAADSPSVQG
jgi:xylulokinase